MTLRMHAMLALMLATTLAAQEPPAFEVASVKPNNSGQPFVRIGGAPGMGRYEASNIPLRLLLTQAFGLQDFQLVNVPSWAESARFDIVARQSTTATREQQLLMLQSLLRERFKLATHTDTREMTISALVPLKADGSGIKLTRSTTDCAALARAGGPGGAPPAFGEKMVCGTQLAPGVINAGAITMERLANLLSQQLRRTVLDRTGLTGNYDVQLTYTPDQIPQGPLPPGVQLPAVDPDGPTLATALQEQLGLKLENQRAPVEVLVIDHLEMPSAD